MDALKVHLLVNYYPAIGFVIGTIVLAVGFLLKNPGRKRMALKVIALMALFAVAVAFTGEFAGQAVKATTEGSRSTALETHKITATAALVSVLIAGIASVVGIVRGKVDAERPRVAYVVVVIFSILASTLLIAAIVKGRQVKWAANINDRDIGNCSLSNCELAVKNRLNQLTIRQLTMNNSLKTENKLWHA